MISLPRTTILYYSFRVRITVFNSTFNNISVISWQYFIVHHKFFAIKEMEDWQFPIRIVINDYRLYFLSLCDNLQAMTIYSSHLKQQKVGYLLFRCKYQKSNPHPKPNQRKKELIKIYKTRQNSNRFNPSTFWCLSKPAFLKWSTPHNLSYINTAYIKHLWLWLMFRHWHCTLAIFIIENYCF